MIDQYLSTLDHRFYRDRLRALALTKILNEKEHGHSIAVVIYPETANVNEYGLGVTISISRLGRSSGAPGEGQP